MKLKELKEKIAKIKDDDLDVVVECNRELHDVLFVKRANYNKRDGKRTARYFLIMT